MRSRPKPPVFPPTQLRLYRLRRHLTLADVSAFSPLSMTRISEIERNPSSATPQEVEEVRRSADRAAEYLGFPPVDGEE